MKLTDLVHRHGKNYAAIVTEPNMGLNGLALFTCCLDLNGLSWCLRDYDTMQELRGKYDKRSLAVMLPLLHIQSTYFHPSPVNTANGVTDWTKHLKDLPARSNLPGGLNNPNRQYQ